MSRTVLVTGVSRHLGARVARGLALHHEVGRVIGLDVIPPHEELGRAEFVRADVRNPVVGRLLNQAKVDTVVHMALSTYHTRGRARSSQKEDNVIGAMQLFAACQQAHHLRRVVLKSTGAVYGSSPHDPAMFTEDQTAPRSRAHGPVRDALEVEGYLRSTRRRRPDLDYTTLRLAHVVGPHMSSPILDYFALPVVPVPFGYDGRLQFLHEDDAVAALIAAVVGPAVGVVNLAAPGVLKLSQAVALAGRPYVLLPTYTGLGLAQLARAGRFTRFGPADLDYLRFGRVLDTSRARDLLGFTPRYSTREAFSSAAEAFPPTVPAVSSVLGWAEALLATLPSESSGPPAEGTSEGAAVEPLPTWADDADPVGAVGSDAPGEASDGLDAPAGTPDDSDAPGGIDGDAGADGPAPPPERPGDPPSQEAPPRRRGTPRRPHRHLESPETTARRKEADDDDDRG